MNLKTASSSDMSKKKVPKDAFHGPAGGSFAQKKKAVLGNVKHSGNEKNISLSKSEPGGSVYSDVNSMSGDNEDMGLTGVNERSLLGSAATTSKANCVNTDTMFGSPLGSPNFTMNDDKIVLSLRLSIFLEKKWIDPKIVKTLVEVSIKKSFALDINLSAVKGNLAMAKTRLIRKFFSSVNGFGGTITPSKFEGIIRSTFTFEESMEKAVLLARENGIITNTNFKKQRVCSDQAVIIKEIPMDTPKEMIVAAVSTFEEIKFIKIQLIGMWQKAVVEFAESDSVHVAKAMEDHNTWASKDYFKVLLFTLPVGTTAHDFGTLLDGAGGKTCIINWSFETGNRVYCAVVGFESEGDLDSAFYTELIFGGVQLLWARLDLVRYEKCGHFGHSALECNVSDVSTPKPSVFLKRPVSGSIRFRLAKLYAKKNVPISCPAAFGDKFCAQVVSNMLSSGHPLFDSGLGFGFFPFGVFGLGGAASLSSVDNSSLDKRLASLKCSFGLLADQVSGIVKRLSFVELVPLVPSSLGSPIAAAAFKNSMLDLDMILDGTSVSSASRLSFVVDGVHNLSSSSSKILISKVGGLEIKLASLEASIGTSMAVIVNNSLARHVFKMEKIPG
ncbi:hypothetical protein G9A89_018354 [Geosiphon pyriformis]|nr:hypothetical protein G9A89_018354 [Geosiphon pyriformis]